MANRPLDPAHGFTRRDPKVVRSEVEAKKARDKQEQKQAVAPVQEEKKAK
jgi:hypothetical protein